MSPDRPTSSAIGDLLGRASVVVCCGAGGGRVFMEEQQGERVNRVRVQQARATGAGQAALACPFCATMFQEGISSQDLQGSLQAADVAVLVAESMGLTY